MGYGQAEQLPEPVERRDIDGKGKQKEPELQAAERSSLSSGDRHDEGPAQDASPRRKHLFKRGERVAIGASGGKGVPCPLSWPPLFTRIADPLRSIVRLADSTVLAYVMKLLNERYDYGLDLCLLSIDEGISGYRDASLDVRTDASSTFSCPPLLL